MLFGARIYAAKAPLQPQSGTDLVDIDAAIDRENKMPQTQEKSLPHFGKNNCHFLWKSTCRLQKGEIEKIAEEVMETGVKFKDACHIASAIFASADYFISTDSRLLKYQTDKIKLINPVDYFIDEAVDQ